MGPAALAALLLACSGGGGGGGTEDRCASVTCTAQGACRVAGACDPATGLCSNPQAENGTACPGGTCQAGACVPTSGALCAGVVCEALDACHPPGGCDPGSGACVTEPAEDGTACPGGVCLAGACVAADGARCDDGVRNGGELAVDCGGLLCAPCSDGAACLAPADCVGGACAGGTCAHPVAALVADPGPTRTVAAGAHVTLDGTRSRSPLGAITSWAWTQVAGPAVTLSGADGPAPSWDAPAGGAAQLAFTLTVGDGVSTATAGLEVRVRAASHPPEDTGLGLVLDALSEGTLDLDTAMSYLAFGVYGDPRLPAAYRGTRPAPSGTTAMAIVEEAFPRLASATQDLLRPFLLPPASPGAYDPTSTGAGLAQRAAAPALPPKQAWVAVSSPHAVVWYRRAWAGGRATATALSRELEAVIWPSLQGVFGAPHMPVRDDAAYPLPKGSVHGKLNVYLTPRLPDAYGVAHTWLPTPAPTWIEVRENLPFHGKLPPGMAQVLAHETTHACQNSYARGAPYAGNRWIYEGTATWGEDHVYPTRNSEQIRAAQLLEYAYLPIDDEWSNRPYSTYLLFQLLTRGNQDDDLIERIFSGFEGRTALAAVDEALPTLEGRPAGFEVWLRPFAAAAWNQDPGAPFWSNDGLEVKGKPLTPALPLSIAGGEVVTMGGVEVPQLGLWEYQFDLTDPTVRQIAFWDGWYYAIEPQTDEGGDFYGPRPGWQPGEDRALHAITTVLVKRQDAWTQLAIPGLGGSLLCQDDPADRADALVVSFANAFPYWTKLLRPGSVDPALILSNIGCYRWEGTVSGVSSPSPDAPVEETSAAVSWQRETLASQAGQNFFTPALVHATWRISGGDGTCTYDGSDAWTDQGLTAGGLFFAMQYTSGPWHRAYRAVGGGHLVTYRVTCPDGQGGQHVTTVQKPVSWIDTSKASDPDWRPKVSADGLQLSGSADDGEMVWTWSFTSAPGP